MQLAIGPMRPDELGLVCNSWKESAKRSPVYARELSGDVYRKLNYDVGRVFESSPIVLVARDPNDASSAYGWACALSTPDVFALVYTYTKHEHRRKGIMQDLLAETLSYVPEGVPTVYCARSRFDGLFEERFGMEPAELSDVLKMARAA